MSGAIAVALALLLAFLTCGGCASTGGTAEQASAVEPDSLVGAEPGRRERLDRETGSGIWTWDDVLRARDVVGPRCDRADTLSFAWLDEASPYWTEDWADAGFDFDFDFALELPQSLVVGYFLTGQSGDAATEFDNFALGWAVGATDGLRVLIGMQYGRARNPAPSSGDPWLHWVNELGFDFGLRGYLSRAGPRVRLGWLLGFRYGTRWWRIAQDGAGADGTVDVFDATEGSVEFGSAYLGLGGNVPLGRTMRLGVSGTLGTRWFQSPAPAGPPTALFDDFPLEYGLVAEVAVPLH